MIRNNLRFAFMGVMCAAGLAASAAAQTDGAYVITISNSVNPSNPSTTVEIWATWTGPDFLFGGGDYDLTASDSTFTSATNVLDGPASTVGVLNGNKVTGASNGQLHIPQLGILGSKDNPILLASYVWTTSDFTARTIRFETSNTNNFILSAAATGSTRQLYPQSFTPGVGLIVPPSPSTMAVVAFGGAMAARRRRIG